MVKIDVYFEENNETNRILEKKFTDESLKGDSKEQKDLMKVAIDNIEYYLMAEEISKDKVYSISATYEVEKWILLEFLSMLLLDLPTYFLQYQKTEVRLMLGFQDFV